MMTYTQVHKTREGFTLIEIMIAIAIIAIIGAVVAPNIYRALGMGQESATKSNLRALKGAINEFYLAMGGEHPDDLRDLVRKPKSEKFATKWKKPFLDAKEIPLDGWKNKFQYKNQSDEEGNPYTLYSYGPKGKGAPKGEWISVWKL